MNDRQDVPEQKTWWLDQPNNVNKLIGLLILVCGMLVLLDAFFVKHGHFYFEESYPIFYGVFGFFSYCFIVFSSRKLRRFLKRDEDYYDR